MIVTKIYIDAENITVESFTGRYEQIDSSEYCEWYNDVSRETRGFRPLKPEDLNILNVELEHIELYLRWELGYFNVYMADDVQVH